MRLLDLCSGVGMLGLGVKLFLEEVGIGVSTTAYCEIAKFPRQVLKWRMEDGSLERAPILRDVTRLPLSDLLGRVDIICAGFPCQPHSRAGQRKGQEDSRWLWPRIENAIGILRPKVIFLENVPGLLNSGFGSVLGGLASLGYDARWCVLGSDNVGASHRRRRWWCMAYDPRFRWPERQSEPSPVWHSLTKQFGLQMANSTGQGWQGWGSLLQQCTEQWLTWEGDAPLPLHAWGPSDSRWKDPPTSPAPPQPAVCGVANGLASRVDRLKAIGNGVDPLAAFSAYRHLYELQSG